MGCQMLFDNFLLLFSSELNDTVVEAQLRTRQVPPPLPNREAIQRYLRANNRLLILVGGCYDIWMLSLSSIGKPLHIKSLVLEMSQYSLDWDQILVL